MGQIPGGLDSGRLNLAPDFAGIQARRFAIFADCRMRSSDIARALPWRGNSPLYLCRLHHLPISLGLPVRQPNGRKIDMMTAEERDECLSRGLSFIHACMKDNTLDDVIKNAATDSSPEVGMLRQFALPVGLSIGVAVLTRLLQK